MAGLLTSSTSSTSWLGPAFWRSPCSRLSCRRMPHPNRRNTSDSCPLAGSSRLPPQEPGLTSNGSHRPAARDPRPSVNLVNGSAERGQDADGYRFSDTRFETRSTRPSPLIATIPVPCSQSRDKPCRRSAASAVHNRGRTTSELTIRTTSGTCHVHDPAAPCVNP